MLAVHPRSAVRGAWIVDDSHWDGLPDGHTRSTTTATADPAAATATQAEVSVLHARVAELVGHVHVAQRPLTDYAAI
ncbi:hypothetical protein [Gordonia alkanivorans]|uniref:hypothetical protein n=1 Tax=Gordonia alkanivorans TaxID=84096 RepID=UPI001FC9D70B|nr:hypothetical protein [Gordonia alkanivorans]